MSARLGALLCVVSLALSGCFAGGRVDVAEDQGVVQLEAAEALPEPPRPDVAFPDRPDEMDFPAPVPAPGQAVDEFELLFHVASPDGSSGSEPRYLSVMVDQNIVYEGEVLLDDIQEDWSFAVGTWEGVHRIVVETDRGGVTAIVDVLSSRHITIEFREDAPFGVQVVVTNEAPEAAGA